MIQPITLEKDIQGKIRIVEQRLEELKREADAQGSLNIYHHEVLMVAAMRMATGGLLTLNGMGELLTWIEEAHGYADSLNEKQYRSEYDAYFDRCEKNNTQPLPFRAWLTGRKSAA